MSLLALGSLLYSLDSQGEDRFFTFLHWLQKLKNFDKKEEDAVRNQDNIDKLNEETHSIKMKKRNFLNKIEVKETDLRNFLDSCSEFRSDIIEIRTDEDMISVIQKMDQHIFGNNPDFLDYLVTAIDKYNLEKNKQTDPSC